MSAGGERLRNREPEIDLLRVPCSKRPVAGWTLDVALVESDDAEVVGGRATLGVLDTQAARRVTAWSGGQHRGQRIDPHGQAAVCNRNVGTVLGVLGMVWTRTESRASLEESSA